MASEAVDTLLHVELNKIRQSPSALRDVNKKTEEYLGLVESIRKEGVLNPITIRPYYDSEKNEDCYMLVDGLHRYTASMDAGKSTVPAHIKSMTDAEAKRAQLIGNIHRIETKPVEYSRHLTRILSDDPTMTISTLAGLLSKSATWLNERLGLTKLVEVIAKAVDAGDINLSNAYAIAKLPAEEQPNWLDRGMTTTPQEFTPLVLSRKKQIDQARREGRDANPEVFEATPHCQKMSTLKDEATNPTIGPAMIKRAKIHKLDSKEAVAEAAWRLAVQWALNMDPESVATAKAAYDARVKSIAEKKEAAKKERAEKRANEAQVKAVRAQLEMETLKANGDVKSVLEAFDKAHAPVKATEEAKASEEAKIVVAA